MSLSRAETQERNRQRLLETARTVFLRDGYTKTSLSSLAQEAGFTTGIVYSSFGSKARLGIAVLHELQDEHLGRLSEFVTSTTAPDDALRGIGQWTEDVVRSGWLRIELEILMDSLDDPDLAPLQHNRQQDATDQVVRLMRVHVPETLIADEPLTTIAEAIVDYSIGLAVRYVADRQASPARLFDLIRPLLLQLPAAPPDS